jgi:hypothetical protein
VLPFFGNLPPCLIGMEACGGAHFWGRRDSRPRGTLCGGWPRSSSSRT